MPLELQTCIATLIGEIGHVTSYLSRIKSCSADMLEAAFPLAIRYLICMGIMPCHARILRSWMLWLP